MAALGERNAEREGLRERAALVLRAMNVQKRHVSDMSEIVVPGIAWMGALIALGWTWHVLSTHVLVVIFFSHVLFRAFARVFINAIWIPRMVRGLGRRFPEFKTEIDDCFDDKDGDD